MSQLFEYYRHEPPLEGPTWAINCRILLADLHGGIKWLLVLNLDTNCFRKWNSIKFPFLFVQAGALFISLHSGRGNLQGSGAFPRSHFGFKEIDRSPKIEAFRAELSCKLSGIFASSSTNSSRVINRNYRSINERSLLFPANRRLCLCRRKCN